MDHESSQAVRERVKILAHFWILQNEPGFWTMNRPKQFANVSKSGSIFGSSKTDQFLDHESSQTVRERVKIRAHFWILQNGPGFWTMNRPKQFANVSKSGPIFGSSKNPKFHSKTQGAQRVPTCCSQSIYGRFEWDGRRTDGRTNNDF